MVEQGWIKLLRKTGRTLPALADELDVNKTTVWRWAVNRIPAERVADVERVTGIPRHHLRPDLYSRKFSNGQRGVQ